MASDGFLPMEITQGEDWTVQVVWTDNYDDPQFVVHPCRMDIKSPTGGTLIQLETNPAIPDGEVPTIGLSEEMGLIQLHLDADSTSAFPPGIYNYDLFVTADDGSNYPGPQQTRLIYGTVSVNKRVTLM